MKEIHYHLVVMQLSLDLSGTRKDMNNNKIHKITLEGNTTSSFIGQDKLISV